MPAANVRVVARFRPLNGREKALIESGADDRGFSITYALFSVRLWITASWSHPFSHLIDAGTDRVTWSSNAGRNRALRRLLWTGNASPPNQPVCISRRLIINQDGRCSSGQSGRSVQGIPSRDAPAGRVRRCRPGRRQRHRSGFQWHDICVIPNAEHIRTDKYMHTHTHTQLNTAIRGVIR